MKATLPDEVANLLTMICASLEEAQKDIQKRTTLFS